MLLINGRRFLKYKKQNTNNKIQITKIPNRALAVNDLVPISVSFIYIKLMSRFHMRHIQGQQQIQAGAVKNVT